MKKLYVVIEIPDEEWAEWSDGYDDPIDPLCDLAGALELIDCRMDINPTVWGSLDDFLHDNVLDALGGIK